MEENKRTIVVDGDEYVAATNGSVLTLIDDEGQRMVMVQIANAVDLSDNVIGAIVRAYLRGVEVGHSSGRAVERKNLLGMVEEVGAAWARGAERERR